MKLCSKCWNSNCNHNSVKIEIDDEISDIISSLNLKGYRTMWCCAGHYSLEYLKQGIPINIYIKFNKYQCPKINPKDIGEGWKFTESTFTLRYVVKDTKKFKEYNGKNNRMKKFYNQPITDQDKLRIELELNMKREELRRWVNKL